jgi:hypothetical protein
MIIGPCPECDALRLTPLPDLALPKWERITCEECGHTYWLRLSRSDPEALTEAEFAAEYVINGRIIRRRGENEGERA